MTISALITTRDSAEIVRDQIAAILAAETTSQQALATTASEDPRLWAFRVFINRAMPWSEFVDPGDNDELDQTPLVNVAFDSETFDKGAGNTVEWQQGDATFHIDCYAYGVSADVPDGGHTAGDQSAAGNVHRVARLVRKILMASEYEDLVLPAVVGRRWIASVSVFQPTVDDVPVQNVLAARITFEVLLGELTPQYEGVPLELVAARITRDGSGEVIEAHFPQTTDS